MLTLFFFLAYCLNHKITKNFILFREELISFVKEVRAQRQGKLSGLTIDAIIAEISAIMKAKKKVCLYFFTYYAV